MNLLADCVLWHIITRQTCHPGGWSSSPLPSSHPLHHQGNRQRYVTLWVCRADVSSIFPQCSPLESLLGLAVEASRPAQVLHPSSEPAPLHADTAPAPTSSPTNPPPVLSPPSQQMELRAAPGSDAAGPSAASPAYKPAPARDWRGSSTPTQTPQTHPQAGVRTRPRDPNPVRNPSSGGARSQGDLNLRLMLVPWPRPNLRLRLGSRDEPEPQAEAVSAEARAQTAPGAPDQESGSRRSTAPVPATQPVQQVEDREDSAGRRSGWRLTQPRHLRSPTWLQPLGSYRAVRKR